MAGLKNVLLYAASVATMTACAHPDAEQKVDTTHVVKNDTLSHFQTSTPVSNEIVVAKEKPWAERKTWSSLVK